MNTNTTLSTVDGRDIAEAVSVLGPQNVLTLFSVINECRGDESYAVAADRALDDLVRLSGLALLGPEDVAALEVLRKACAQHGIGNILFLAWAAA